MSTSLVQPGDLLPVHRFSADTVQLFLYNAAIWNPHRIHYDLPYAQAEEGHPQLLIDGPLQGDWLTQVLYDWIGERGMLGGFQYRNRRAAYVGETLVSEGRVIAVDGDQVQLELCLRNAGGDVTTQATATVRWSC